MDSKDLTKVQKDREEKLKILREKGFNYPNKFEKKDYLGEISSKYSKSSKSSLEDKKVSICTAGRIVLKRVMGNAAFMTLEDSSGRLQIFLSRNKLNEKLDEAKDLDLGDIIGVKGILFRTNTDELTVDLDSFELLTKSLKPMPEKHKGLTDIETIYRKRYLDLMSNPESREVFIKRNKIIKSLRTNLESNGFLEVETPMMHPIPGGANARPFETHHNALDKKLYLRVAPELYLKRLLVGGYEKVFEINRNFRNEGISTIHNPEFTMLEFYEAYGDLQRTVKFIQKLIQDSILAVNDSLKITYDQKNINFEKDFEIRSLKELVKEELNVESLENEDSNIKEDFTIQLTKEGGYKRYVFREHLIASRTYEAGYKSYSAYEGSLISVSAYVFEIEEDRFAMKEEFLINRTTGYFHENDFGEFMAAIAQEREPNYINIGLCITGSSQEDVDTRVQESEAQGEKRLREIEDNRLF